MKNRGLKRSFIDFKRHPWLHFVSVSTITISLLLLGTFLLCYRNFEVMAEKTTSQITGTVYLRDALSPSEVEGLKDRILTLGQVRNVTYKTKHSVMEELQTFLGASVTESLPGGELFPDVIELEVRKDATSAQIAEVKNIVGKYSEVSEVDFSEDWLMQFKRIRQILRVFGIVLMIGIIVGCGFIIANFMGMRHQSRKDEIEIVRLIGAHRNFVLAPFIWEGIIEGVIGASTALTLLYLLNGLLNAVISGHWASLLGITKLLYLSPQQFVAMLFIGIGMAFFGSVTVFLRFQEHGA